MGPSTKHSETWPDPSDGDFLHICQVLAANSQRRPRSVGGAIPLLLASLASPSRCTVMRGTFLCLLCGLGGVAVTTLTARARPCCSTYNLAGSYPACTPVVEPHGGCVDSASEPWVDHHPEGNANVVRHVFVQALHGGHNAFVRGPYADGGCHRVLAAHSLMHADPGLAQPVLVVPMAAAVGVARVARAVSACHRDCDGGPWRPVLRGPWPPLGQPPDTAGGGLSPSGLAPLGMLRLAIFMLGLAPPVAAVSAPFCEPTALLGACSRQPVDKAIV